MVLSISNLQFFSLAHSFKILLKSLEKLGEFLNQIIVKFFDFFSVVFEYFYSNVNCQCFDDFISKLILGKFSLFSISFEFFGKLLYKISVVA